MSENEVNALASALRGLTPSAQPLNRDALMFLAGRATVPPRRGLWPAATAATALVALALGLVVVMRSPEVRTVERIVHVPQAEPAPAPPFDPPSDAPPGPAAATAGSWELPATEYEKVRDDVLRWGLDGLPPAPKGRSDHTSAGDLMHPF